METLTIEVIQKKESALAKKIVINHCEEYILTKEVFPDSILNEFDEPLLNHVQSIIIGENRTIQKLEFSKLDIKWYVYKLDDYGCQSESMHFEEGQENIPVATHWVLPSADFHGLWENLIYDSDIKDNLLRYVQTTMLFSDKGVDANIVCSNKVVLLHGPPGTGKTSLCKALSHKLSARLQQRYRHGQLIEINSHNLFSKWFSESGKLVTTMFSKIHDVIADSKVLVCVLIDEVESLAHARQQCMSGAEPSDAIRVVNAVLTQIDQIKKFPNVLILTTSNMTGAIDLAFVDRADIKQFIGLPSAYAIYQIYYSCIQELIRAEVIVPADVILPANVLKITDFEKNCVCQRSRELKKICDASVGFSGRTLRKIPFVAHALFVKSDIICLNTFLGAMISAVEYFKREKLHFEM